MKKGGLSGCGGLVVVAVLIIAFCAFSSASAGSVGKTAEENLILFYEGDTVPAGWTCISDNLGEPFYQIFPRGSGTYGGTGGSSTHTHTASLVSCSGPSENVRACPFDLYAFPTSTHTHGLFDADIFYELNLPKYRNLKVIKYNNGVPTTIPAGAISIFDTAPPAGWTRYSAQDNYFVRGGAIIVAGGSNTHNHLVEVTTDRQPVTELARDFGAPIVSGAAATIHGHSWEGTTAQANNEPPYITVILAKADSDTTIPEGMVAMFDATPPGAWEVISGSGQPFNQRFIKGGTTYGTTGGSSSHPHADLTITTGGPDNTHVASYRDIFVLVASDNHTHTITLSLSENDHLPPYVDVIFAKYTPEAVPEARPLIDLRLVAGVVAVLAIVAAAVYLFRRP